MFFEIGHTIINLLADFRSYQYMLPQIKGVTIHMENKKTVISLPRNQYNDVRNVLLKFVYIVIIMLQINLLWMSYVFKYHTDCLYLTTIFLVSNLGCQTWSHGQFYDSISMEKQTYNHTQQSNLLTTVLSQLPWSLSCESNN